MQCYGGNSAGGGSATVIPSSEDILTYFSQPRASGVYSGLENAGGPESPSGTFDSGKYEWILGYLDRYGTLRFTSYNHPFYSATNILVNGAWRGWVLDWNSNNLSPVTANTNQIINAVKEFRAEWASLTISPETLGGASYIQGNDFNGAGRFILGALDPNSNVISLRNLNGSASVNVLPNRTIDLFCDVINTTGAKGFVRNAKGSPGFNGIGDIQQSWRSEQRMGSVLDTSNSRWRSFINVLHRGGNDNQETTGGDSHDWGFVFVDDNMTSTSHNFRIIKLRAGVWGNGVDLYHTGNVTADANGYLKTASPVINIYADGSFTTTDEAAGVNVERLSEGVYKITGCQGMHPDAAWNGIDGGVSNPKCRNDKALLWNNYEVDEDGSVTVYTFHRVHSDAMPFAQNRLTLDKAPFDPELGHTPDMEWPDQTPIDVPRGLFIQVRVNMPKRIEPKPAVMSSNVYCSTISPAK